MKKSAAGNFSQGGHRPQTMPPLRTVRKEVKQNQAQLNPPKTQRINESFRRSVLVAETSKSTEHNSTQPKPNEPTHYFSATRLLQECRKELSP